jgi:DNA mismatch endonuclease, patch repair protein
MGIVCQNLWVNIQGFPGLLLTAWCQGYDRGMGEVLPGRSRIMRSIRSRDTRPELKVRKALWSRGYRYRVNVRSLPGRPDIVFSSRRVAIFVHGCYWHQHHCQRGRLPRKNTGYWVEKFARNKARDESAEKALRTQGWKVLTIWECELERLEAVTRRIEKTLGPPGQTASQRRLPKCAPATPLGK